MVTMEDVARLAGVSKMTVSNVVNNRDGVGDLVRQRVLEAIRQSGYRVNVSARTLRSGRTGVIGLAVPDIELPYFGHLAAHVIEAAGRQGFHVAIEQTGAAAAGEADAIAHSRTLHFDGLILSAVELDRLDEHPAEAGYPLVMLGEQDFGGRFDHVAMPNEEGTKAATTHLADRGCRRIAIVTGRASDDVNMVTRRHYGYLAALAERGIGVDPALVFSLDDASMEAGREAACRLVDSGHEIDGVVAVTDTVALGVLRGLADRGLRVPEDVRLIGFDDIPESGFTVPSLSTVAPDHRWMAERAVELVAQRIRAPLRPTAQYVAPFELVIRESTR
ncbi:LacI family DNA-binding transcriptional regulator [Planotetraspora phitsanulokensis]|uniref:LacI family transcriptional regulator n=1 Tax=Planotetraspora phitsanulokensis TaxID=575192 RepID=A0A8J3XJ35_9ACTN|nr:LacI family DNA-binding transcriptional regulator [Planotetraspora phitsanulokensis]GII43009.1 LacI family transcriptional regulator [Planotetraspora phitsanulokensis]